MMILILYLTFIIINCFLILLLHQNLFKTKLKSFKFITCFCTIFLIQIFLNNPICILFFILLYLIIKLSKLNLSKAILTSILVLSLYLISKFTSICLKIPNYFCIYLFSILLLISNLIILKNNLIIHINKFPTYMSIINLITIVYQIIATQILSISLTFVLSFILINLLFIYSLVLSVLNYNKHLEIENLNLICDTTRAFKHDFNNIMHAIGGYIQTNNLDDLKQYYNKLIPECFCINNLYRFHSKLMENSALYSIISNKYNLAEKNNIKMSLDISSNLNNLRIDDYSLTRIIGILLDNSIEAAKETNQKIINISFEENKNEQLIIIENTFLNRNISLTKIFEKHYTTKRNNSGLGLWEVKKILNKCKNLNLSTSIENDFFVQKLEIL